jgi:G3E family GTPase
MTNAAASSTVTVRDARTPVIVISGFLGAGKTTLLKRALQTPALSHSLLIVNEIGEIGIDHHLLERSDDRTLLLDNGCMCCQLRGDLQELLVDVGMRRKRGELPSFDRVIIETSGLADPGPVARTLYSDAPLLRDYRLGHVVTLIDPTNVSGRKAAPAIAARQVAAADRIVFSKSDRASLEQREEAYAWMRSVNAYAECEDAAHGEIDAAALADATPFAWFARQEPEEGAYLGRHVAPHPAEVTSFALTFDDPVPRALFQEFIDLLVRLRGADLLRVKGILRFDDAGTPVVVQGVGHVFDREVPLARGASMPATSTLIVIARRVARADVQALWQVLSALAPVAELAEAAEFSESLSSLPSGDPS